MKYVFSFFLFFFSILQANDQAEFLIGKHYNKIVKIVSKHQLQPYGMGIAGPILIRKITFNFQLYEKKPTVDEARILAIELYDEIINSFNLPEELKDKFVSFPVSEKNFNLIIGFGYDGKEVYKRPFVSMVACSDRGIEYDALDEKSGFPEVFLREPLEEARKIVKEQQPTPKYFEPSMFMVSEEKKGFFWKN